MCYLTKEWPHVAPRRGGGISWWEERLLSIKTRPAVSRISIKVYKSPDQSRLKYHESIRISFRAKSSSLLTRPRWSSTKLSLQAFKSDCQHKGESNVEFPHQCQFVVDPKIWTTFPLTQKDEFQERFSVSWRCWSDEVYVCVCVVYVDVCGHVFWPGVAL